MAMEFLSFHNQLVARNRLMAFVGVSG